MSGHVLLHKNAVSYLQSCFNQRKPLILSNNSRAVDVQFHITHYGPITKQRSSAVTRIEEDII